MSSNRILRIKLKRPLAEALKTSTKAALASDIGISRPKLNAIINEEWSYITRDAIERTADYFQLDVGDVFEFLPVDFWRPFEQAKSCTLLRGSHDPPAVYRDLRIPYFDSSATGVIEGYFRAHVPAVADFPYVDHLREQKEIVSRAERESCIVIGSPKSNAATEILLSRFFGAEPFNPSTSNRRKIPFGFCWPEDTMIAQQSSLTCSAAARDQLSGHAGIALQGGSQVRADYLALRDFTVKTIRKGVDCGLVFVANRPFQTPNEVKLIVLAGWSGIGTLAAAKALVEDFRHLEPLEGEDCVFGVIEAYYTKPANSNNRTFKGFAWRYRRGGSSPIPSGRKKRE